MLGFVAMLTLAPLAPVGRMDPLKTDLVRIADRFHGRLGFYVKNLETGEVVQYRGQERFPTASTIKTAIAVHAIREVDAGRMKWAEGHPLPNAAQRIEYDASQWSYSMKDGVVLNLDGYVNLMITMSDNLATRVLREWLETVKIDATLQSLGLKDTLCLSSAPKTETRLRRLNGQFGMGMTTPAEMGQLLELIYRRKAASPAGCERLLRILCHQYWDDWIASTVPPGVAIASKSGAINRSRSDTAIVFAKHPYILTIYTDSQKDQHWSDENEGDLAIRKMATLVWKALEPETPYTPPIGYQKFLPTGGGAD
jgi:beta-lactamase class A